MTDIQGDLLLALGERVFTVLRLLYFPAWVCVGLLLWLCYAIARRP